MNGQAPANTDKHREYRKGRMRQKFFPGGVVCVVRASFFPEKPLQSHGPGDKVNRIDSDTVGAVGPAISGIG